MEDFNKPATYFETVVLGLSLSLFPKGNYNCVAGVELIERFYAATGSKREILVDALRHVKKGIPDQEQKLRLQKHLPQHFQNAPGFQTLLFEHALYDVVSTFGETLPDDV